MTRPAPHMNCLAAGRQGLLVELRDPADVMRLYAELRRRRPAGIVDIVPAARTVLLTGPCARELAEALPAWPLPEPVAMETSQLEIPVVYDGADLAEVAEGCGLSVAQLVECHAQARYRVAFCGFMPGFGYLEGLPPALHRPRRDTPRTQVPAGSVAIAGRYAGVYPRASPGGWHLLGRTALELWNPQRQPPARLSPGTSVRFVPVAP